MATVQQALRHRNNVAELTGLADRDLAVLFGEFDTADDARDGLMDVLPRLVAVYGAAAATLGADWYDEIREAAGIDRRFRAITAEPPGGTDELARWGIGPLFQDEPDWSSAQTLVAGGLQRRIADADRASVTSSAIADPAAEGWQRVGVGECDYCKERIGGLYTAADFPSHDHCGCVAAPAW